jgi:hypothetical protein
MPVEELKRTVIGVEGAEKWGADERSFAAGVGVNVPVSMMPLAWAGGMLVRSRGGGRSFLTRSEAWRGVEDSFQCLDDFTPRLNGLFVFWERHFGGCWSGVRWG